MAKKSVTNPSQTVRGEGAGAPTAEEKSSSATDSQEASGTAREAPSTGGGAVDENQHAGTQSAPPHTNSDLSPREEKAITGDQGGANPTGHHAAATDPLTLKEVGTAPVAAATKAPETRRFTIKRRLLFSGKQFEIGSSAALSFADFISLKKAKVVDGLWSDGIGDE
jgi:hypothetical protein